MDKHDKKASEAKSEIIRRIPRACSDELAAVEFLEEQRWNGEAVCPHCGCVGNAKKLLDTKTSLRNKRFLWYCPDCKSQFTVRVGTVFEDSRIPLRHWCYAFWAASVSKKGVSAKQIQRQCLISYKSALFLMHRIRYAMTEPNKASKLTGTIEADETYIGGKPQFKGQSKRGRGTRKQPVMAIVQRNGNIRTRVIADISGKTLKKAIRQEVDRSARIMTDDLSSYRGLKSQFKGGHHVVNHTAGEYVRGDVFTNTAESFFALFKRGIHGTFHSVSRKHLPRYLHEFSFRWDHRKINDGARLATAIRGAEGKRLMYKEPVSKAS
jgi:transposase-like protein